MRSVYPHVTIANKYARDVVSGRIPACVHVVNACKRHVADLEQSKNAGWPYLFNKEKAEKICKFAEMMPHVKGKWDGATIHLEPWQCFILASIFGWVQKSDGLRRYREMYAEIPRKNGKSVLGSVIGLFMFAVDGESGAEVYSAANSEKQAFEVFRPAWLMTNKIAAFRKKYGIEQGGNSKNPGNIFSLKTGARFETVIGKPGDGASPHCWIQDEYHESKTDEAYDTGKTGMGARPQPLMCVVTTAGTSTASPCYEKRKIVEKVLAGKIENDRLFGIIYSIDHDDDWTDFNIWKKANPNFGVSVFEDFLLDQYKTAIRESRKQNILKCKHLNIWSNSGNSWLNPVEWEQAVNKVLTIDDFWGEPAFVGLDLASKIDVASLMALFRRDGHYYLFSNHYIPETRIHGEDMAHYAGWVHDGYMTTTPGNRIDFEYIKADIRQLAKNHDLSGEEMGGGAICNDPWNAQQLITELMNEQIACVEVPQTVSVLSEPMKEIEAALKDGKFHHDGNPVTRWMFENVMVNEDKKGNIFPFKDSEKNKIDGAVATITAMRRAMLMANDAAGNDGTLINYDWDDI